MTSDLQVLISRFLDNREGLSEDEYELLVMGLRENPDVLVNLKDQLVLDELLAQWLAVDRRNFVAQVRQRVHDQGTAESLDEQVEEMRELAANELRQWQDIEQDKRRKRRWSVSIMLTLAVVTFAGGFGLRAYLAPLATVAAVKGDVTCRRGGVEHEVTLQTGLRIGDIVETGGNGGARLAYPDGTVLELRSDSLVELLERGADRVVNVERGDLTAKVAKQRKGHSMIFATPVADATVLGTELLLFVRTESTRLDVVEGSVRLRAKKAEDSKVAIVKENQYGVATSNDLTVKSIQWPTSRAGLSLIGSFESPQEPALADSQENLMPLQVRGKARGTTGRLLLLEGGAFIADPQAAGALLQQCRASGELTVEATLRRLDDTANRSRVITFSGEGGLRNFSLWQRQGGVLALRLRTSKTDEDGFREVALCQLSPQESHHVIVSYRPGMLVCYLDGRLVHRTEDLQGDFANWSEQYLVFGDEWEGQELQWHGELSELAIFHRFMHQDEAYRNTRAIRRRSRPTP